jgi:predicted O-linked N-acetylglucosamine transferase (SPINDLY family)
MPTMAAYEACAVALAKDPARLAALKQTIARNRASSALFDTALFTRHLEAAYTQMIDAQRAGRAPAAFQVA